MILVDEDVGGGSESLETARNSLGSVAGGWYERQSISMMADIIDESWEWWIRRCRDKVPWKSQGFTVNGFGG